MWWWTCTPIPRRLSICIPKPVLAAGGKPWRAAWAVKSTCWRGGGVACLFDESYAASPGQLAESLPVAHPLACLAVTLEFSQPIVDEKLAREDAIRLLAFLRHRGVLRGEPPPLPPLPFPPTLWPGRKPCAQTGPAS